MLKDLDPLLSADLLWMLAAMGHGDELALVDANHPAERIARSTASGRLVHLPGISIERAATAILSVFPLDSFVDHPVRRMEVVGNPAEIPPVQVAFRAVLEQETARPAALGSLERFAFYAAAGAAFGVVQTGDLRPYGCFLLRKGVINP
jgi:L-fucose mutarotase